MDPESVVWSGLPVSKEEALSRYDVDAVQYTTETNDILNSDFTPKTAVYGIAEQISEGVNFASIKKQEHSLVKTAIEECRVIKDEYEIALIRRANLVSTEAHKACMRAAKTAKNERELEAIFLERCVALGCREQAYHGIFASGTNAATLHYIHNNQPLSGRLNLLLDAAAEVDCYAADITRTFPLSGKFSPESLSIYNLVLKMQKDCTAILKAGVVWDDVHLQAHRIMIKGLLDLGILKDGTEEEILNAKTSAAFLPHGLGHYLGMDTHDTGGHANYADEDPRFKYLRIRGKVPVGSVLTVEPGVYFCRFIIEPFLEHEEHSKYIDKEVLEKYWEVGGVRIEGKSSFPLFEIILIQSVDDILITEDGYENLTPTLKEVSEIEELMNG